MQTKISLHEPEQTEIKLSLDAGFCLENRINQHINYQHHRL